MSPGLSFPRADMKTVHRDKIVEKEEPRTLIRGLLVRSRGCYISMPKGINETSQLDHHKFRSARIKQDVRLQSDLMNVEMALEHHGVFNGRVLMQSPHSKIGSSFNNR